MRRQGMLALALGLALGCGGNTTPAVQRSLDSLPDDPVRREDAIQSTAARPTAESRKSFTKGERKVEAGAATAAAIVGSILSTSHNTDIGIGVALDPVPDVGSGPIPGPDPVARPPASQPAPQVDPKTIVPWVEIKPPADAPPK